MHEPNPFKDDPQAVGTASPHPAQAAPKRPPGEDATGGLIPYNNPPALASYYLGIVSLLPVLGLPFTIAAIVLAFKGFKKRRENPAVRGHIHAGIGLALAIFSLPIQFLSYAGIIAAIFSA